MKLTYGEFMGRTSKQVSTPGFALSEIIDADIPEVPRHTHEDDQRLYREFLSPDQLSDVVLESAALELFGMMNEHSASRSDAPGWLRYACELIQDRCDEPVRSRTLRKL